MACVTSKLDSEVSVAKAAHLPAHIQQLGTTLGLSNEKAITLIVSLHHLLKQYIATSMMDETILAN